MAGLKGDRPRKRKADESSFAGEERSPSRAAAKRTDRSEGSEKMNQERDAMSAAAPAMPKKMWRLPKKEIDQILAQGNEPVYSKFRALKRRNPSLVPSPEEAEDEHTALLYACARDAYEDEAKFAVFQAWVRAEYAAKGSVEVDYDYFGEREEARRACREARDEVFRGRDLESDSDDDDVWRHLKRRIRSFDA